MSTKSNVATALIALAAGAALGILFAPASGRDTRKKISDQASKLRDSLTEKMEEGRELVDKMKGAAGDLANKGKEAANRVKETAHETASTARSAGNGGYKG